jgi:hypothetical protein
MNGINFKSRTKGAKDKYKRQTRHGYGVYTEDVKESDKYDVTTPPKIFSTRKQAEKLADPSQGDQIFSVRKEAWRTKSFDDIKVNSVEEMKSRTQGAKDKQKRKTRGKDMIQNEFGDWEETIGQRKKELGLMEAGEIWDHPSAQDKVTKEIISGAQQAKDAGAKILNPRGLKSNRALNQQLWSHAEAIAKRTSPTRAKDPNFVLQIYKRMGGKVDTKSRTKGAKDKQKRKTRGEFIADMVQNYEDLTTSDLQGVVDAYARTEGIDSDELLNEVYEEVKVKFPV